MEKSLHKKVFPPVFGRPTEDGHVALFHNPDGEVVTSIRRLREELKIPEYTTIYPVNSDGVNNEWAEGIILSVGDAQRLNIQFED